jgi:hypothetical protein
LDFSRLRTGEIVAAVGGIALFVFMFFDWFGGGVEVTTGGTQEVPGIGEVPTGAPEVSETGVSAWDGLQDFSGFLIALAAVSGVTMAGLAMAGQRLNLPFQRGVGTLTLANLAILLILWRMLANPGDLEIGIFLGLIAAVAIAIGAWIALREDGFEPLVKVPGGRTRAASASAPAATPTPRPATAPSGGSSSGGSRSSGSTATKSRSAGGKSAAKKSAAKKSAAKKSPAKKSTTSRSKTSGSSRSKSSGSSKPKPKPKSSGSSARSKSSRSSARSKSSSSKSRSSRSSGTRKRSSGGRK